MATPTVYVICDQNCKFESMTKEQILAAIAQAVSTGEITDVDAGFIQTIKTINGVSLKFFYGEQSAYDALSEEEKENLYAIITNDTTISGLKEAIKELSERFNNGLLKIEHGGTGANTVDGAISNLKGFNAMYNLGAFDTVVDNGDGTATITRKTGYICFDGVTEKVKTCAENGDCLTEQELPYILCPNSHAAAENIVSNYLPTVSNNDVAEYGKVGIAVQHHDGHHAAWCGQIRFRLPDDKIKTVEAANEYLSKNPLYIQYKLVDNYSYIEKVSKYNTVDTLDQQGQQWVRSEWGKGLNLWTGDNIITAIGVAGSDYSGDTIRTFWITNLVAGKTYTLHVGSSIGTNSANAEAGFVGYVEVYDSNEHIATMFNSPRSFTTISDTIMVRFYPHVVGHGLGLVENTQTYTNIMLNEGNRAYPYQPYCGGIARENGTYPDMTVGTANGLSEPAASGTYPNMTVGNATNADYAKNATDAYTASHATTAEIADKIHRELLWSGTHNVTSTATDIFLGNAPVDLYNKTFEMETKNNGNFKFRFGSGEGTEEHILPVAGNGGYMKVSAPAAKTFRTQSFGSVISSPIILALYMLNE